MIGYIQGRLIVVDSPHVLLVTGGVGYEIEVPLSALVELSTLGSEYALFAHLVVREDAQLLYGFITRQDRDLFRVLLKVNGVGPKLAVSILSHLTASDVVQLVHAEDIATFTRLPGIGKKTAERLLIDLRDRLRHWSFQPEPGPAIAHGTISADGASTFTADDHAHTRTMTPAQVRLEAETALIALGYKPAEATRVIAAVYTEAMASDELIRQALRSMVRGK